VRHRLALKSGYIATIVGEINERATTHPFGQLQKVRQLLKKFKRLPARAPFRGETIFPTYAFHVGGRKELQFNIGEEPEQRLRHGVAFSFQTNQTLPDVKLLIPKVARFNEFLRVHPDLFDDMLMWHWNKAIRSPGEQRPSAIPDELVKKDFFVFLGKMQPMNKLDLDLIISDFDRLLDLYRFVEGNEIYPANSQQSGPFVFRSGNNESVLKTKRKSHWTELDVDLRHKAIQTSLYNHLSSIHGARNVGSEIPCPSGSIDVVVKQADGYVFFEIKTSMSARACIREGLSQILEYSYWPGSQTANKLVIVGERALDGFAAKYIQTLKKQFSLPISYQQFDMTAQRLVS
jgi:hypothetical protein